MNIESKPFELSDSEIQTLNETIPPGSPTYYATRFLPPSWRHRLLPLYALHQTLQAIPDTCSDPGVARVKCHWWLEQLNQLTDNQTAHPLLQILVRLHRAGILAKTHCARLTQSALFKLSTHHFETDEEYHQHHIQARGALTETIADLQGINPETGYIQALGKCINILERCVFLNRDKQHGRCLLPPERMLQLGIDFDFSKVDKLPALITECLAVANKHFLHYQHHSQHRYRLQSEEIYAKLLMKSLTDSADDFRQLVSEKSSMTPLRQCWFAYFWSREIKKSSI